MKILDAILLSVVAAFLIIGLYHTFRYGIEYSYFMFMIVAFSILWLNARGVGKVITKSPQNLPTQKHKKKIKNTSNK